MQKRLCNTLITLCLKPVKKRRFSESFYYHINLCFIILSLSVFLGNQPSIADTQIPQPPPTVKIAQPVRKTITQWDEYTGRIDAVNIVELRARVSGYLEKVNFKAGENVKKGDVLFVLDSRPYKAQLNYATAELEKNKTKRDLAKNDLVRAQSLFKANAISAEEFDNRNNTFKEAVAAVASAEANVLIAQINLDDCQLKAPIDGRISKETFTTGNLINSAENQSLATIMSMDPVYMYADIDEQAVLKYRRQAAQANHHITDLKGMPVALKLSSENDYTHQGHIDYLSPKEDTKTSTITIRGIFSNPDELLRPGYFARMRVQSDMPYSALLIPDRAIGTDQAQHFVWIVKEDNQVEYRQVKLGAHEQGLRVITEGVAAEEWIVTDGLLKVRPQIKDNPERLDLHTLPENQ